MRVVRERKRRMVSGWNDVYLAYIPFEWHALAWAPVEEISPRTRRFAKTRSLFTLGTFFIAMLVSLKFPSLGFGLICCALLVYLRPEPLGPGNEATNKLVARGAGQSQGEQDARPDCPLEI